MKTIFQWLVYSSKDPSKLSLTLKGIITGIITLATVYGGVSHIDMSSVTSIDTTVVIDQVISIVQAAVLIGSSFMTLYGFIRKVWVTVTTKQ